ncbi:MAG: 3-deoxy-8-phosphooctulonate synthase [Candidatus Omnitrophota bacterium]
MEVKQIKIKNITLGGKSLVLIAGPCVIETEKSVLRHATLIKKIAEAQGFPFIFKSSYDKANRTSIRAFRGLGIEKGLKILAKVKRELNIPVLSDVHSVQEVKRAAEVLDIIQIPAFLCRQTDLLIAAARTKKVVNVKKGQFLSPDEVVNIIEKIEKNYNKNILITERGTAFGYNNLVNDFRALPIIRSFGYPVIFDATHSVQMPGGGKTYTSGQREFIECLTRAAVAVGCDGIFLEVHETPDRAPCDGPNMLPIHKLEELLLVVSEINQVMEKYKCR